MCISCPARQMGAGRDDVEPAHVARVVVCAPDELTVGKERFVEPLLGVLFCACVCIRWEIDAMCGVCRVRGDCAGPCAGQRRETRHSLL